MVHDSQEKKLPSKELNLLMGLRRNNNVCPWISYYCMFTRRCSWNPSVRSESDIWSLSPPSTANKRVCCWVWISPTRRGVCDPTCCNTALSQSSRLNFCSVNHFYSLCFYFVICLQRSVHHRSGAASVERHPGLPGWRWVKQWINEFIHTQVLYGPKSSAQLRSSWLQHKWNICGFGQSKSDEWPTSLFMELQNSL